MPWRRETATRSIILAWRILWTEDLGRLQSMMSQRVRHDWATFTSLYLEGVSISEHWEFAGEIVVLLLVIIREIIEKGERAITPEAGICWAESTFSQGAHSAPNPRLVPKWIFSVLFVADLRSLVVTSAKLRTACLLEAWWFFDSFNDSIRTSRTL